MIDIILFELIKYYRKGILLSDLQHQGTDISLTLHTIQIQCSSDKYSKEYEEVVHVRYLVYIFISLL